MDIITYALAKGKSGGGGGVSQIQSDWNQNDNTQKDYIKNRPFYKEEKENIVSLVYTNNLGSGLTSTDKIGLKGNATYEAVLKIRQREIPFELTTVEGEYIIGGAQLEDSELGTLQCNIIDGVDSSMSHAGSLCVFALSDEENNMIEEEYTFEIKIIADVINQLPSEYISPTCKVYYYPISENIHLDSSLAGNKIKYTLDIDITDANGAYIYENGPKIQAFGSAQRIVPFSNKIEAIAFIMSVSGHSLYMPLDLMLENNAVNYAVPFFTAYNTIVQRTGKIYSLENSIEYIFSTAEEASSKYQEMTLDGVTNIIVKENTPISQEIRL